MISSRRGRARGDVDVLVVCSDGGHLFDALALRSAWAERTHAWVSFNKADTRALLAGERLYLAHGPTNRSIRNLVRNLRVAWNVVGETRPAILVTTGAGVGVPFAWIARLRGATIVYVESSGRVDRPSLSGRLIAPVASHVYAQWPELAAGWRRARYLGNALMAQSRVVVPVPGHGVFVTVGMSETPFDRLLRAIPLLNESDVVVQYGASSVRPSGARCRDYVAPEEAARLTRSARVVVTHAGAGSVAMALAQGRRPVVVPRLHRLGEAVDDHQLFFARRLAASGLATLVEDVGRLPDVVEKADHLAAREPGIDLAVGIQRLIDALLDARNHGSAAPLWT